MTNAGPGQPIRDSIFPNPGLEKPGSATLVDMANPKEVQGLFAMPKYDGPPVVSPSGQVIFSNPYDSFQTAATTASPGGDNGGSVSSSDGTWSGF